jgi:hypothetical protein
MSEFGRKHADNITRVLIGYLSMNGSWINNAKSEREDADDHLKLHVFRVTNYSTVLTVTYTYSKVLCSYRVNNISIRQVER